MIGPPWARGARAALVFLTRIPAGGFPYSPREFRWASGYFPWVGVVLGVIYAAVAFAVAPSDPPLRALIVLGLAAILTGGFHEDGLADTADALGGGWTAGRVLEILKDSRIGSYGALALAWALLARYVGYCRVDGWWTLVAAQAGSRLPPVVLMAALPYVTQDAAAKSRVVAQPGWGQVSMAFGWIGAVGWIGIGTGVVTWSLALGALGAAFAAAAIVGAYGAMRVGGLTGDFLGAAQQMGEIAILFALTAPG